MRDYYFRQRLFGVIAIVLSVILFKVADGTVMSLLMAGLGVYIILTDSKIIVDYEDDEEDFYE